ncbi:MAG: hypothetical protein FJX57_10370 [Alphaproteobacteria bacterium]|nr:hypothetical protein [Alphaproteobacteria bacterium]
MTRILSSSALPFRVSASGAGRLAAQLTLAAIPLVAVSAFGAGPREIGLLMAIHDVAWLAVSVPGGALIDRMAPRRPAMVMLAASAAALCMAGLAGVTGTWMPFAIALCSVFWNIACFAQVAILVPFAVEIIGISPSEATASQGALGVEAIAAAFVAPDVMARVAPRVVLVLGPAASLADAVSVSAVYARRRDRR